ncbi:MAG: TonB-dependent receptor plug domain-containing protein [Chitinophagales bacterium]
MSRILCLCVFLWGTLQAQTINIISKETKEALAFVSVSSNEPFVSTTTNIDGKADISAFKSAKKINIRLIGYEAEVFSYDELKALEFKLQLKTSAFAVDDVVVSAVKWKQKNAEVPMKVSSISAKEVALQNPQTTADMLASSGEVFVQKSQQGGGSPMIRGFSTNRLLYSVDGVRMNTAIFRSGNLQNVISLDAFSIENTEVLFGPGSIMYGSDAIGGVMSFSTLQTKFSETKKAKVSGSALARYASANNEKTGHFDVQVAWKKWAFLSSVTYTDYDNLKMGRQGPDEYLRNYYVERIDSIDIIKENKNPLVQNPTAYSQINLMQKLSYKASKNLRLDYGFHYSETSHYGRYDRHIRTRNGLPRSAVWDYGPQIWMMNHLAINFDKSNIVFDQMKISLAHQYFKESRIDRNFGKTEQNTNTEKVFAYAINADFLKKIAAKHQVFYGLEFVNNVVHSTGEAKNILTNKTEPAASRYPTAGWATAAAYLNYQFKANEKWLLQGGLRYSHFFINADFSSNQSFYNLPETSLSTNNGALTGSLGAIFSPNVSTKLSANFSTGFRAPNIDDVGKIFDSEPGAVVVPNTNLKSEYVYNGEIGFAQVIKNAVKIDFSAYYTYLQNALVRRNFQLNGQDSIVYLGELSQVQAIQNAASANVYGIQFGVEVKLPEGFSFNGVYNYQRGVEELANGKKSASRHAAPMFGAAHLKYKWKTLNLDLYTLFSASVKFENLPEGEKTKDYIYAIDENGNPYSPAWATLNFKAQYQINKIFGIGAGVENILDTRYKTYSSGIAAPGRNFVLSAKASF